MAKTIEQLKTQSAEVKNASVIGENTATRVGSLFNDIVEHVEAYEAGQAQKDTEQSTSINEETIRATAAETTLSERINQEVIDRKAMNETIGVQLSNEIERAKKMELGISTKLDGEIKRAQEAENNLQEQITSEAEARDLAINNETQARTQNDQLLSQAIAAEQERAEAAEQANAYDIDLITENVTIGGTLFPKDIFSVKNNREYAEVHIDEDGKILWAITKTGDFVFGCGTPSSIHKEIEEAKKEHPLKPEIEGVTIKDVQEVTTGNTPEYISVILDNGGKMLEYLKKDGTHFFAKLASPELDGILKNTQEFKEQVDTDIALLKEQIAMLSRNSGKNIFHYSATPGDVSYILSPFNENNKIKTSFKVRRNISAFYENSCFNFIDVSLVDNDTLSEKIVDNCLDDIAPGNWNGTYIGANHGCDDMRKCICTGHNKTFVDIGSIWSCDGYNYTLIGVSDDSLYLLGDNMRTYPNFSMREAPVGTYTHVSGATHPEEFTVTSSTLSQMYNQTRLSALHIFVDDKEITESGDYQFETMKICEVYDVINQADSLAEIQRRVGTFTSNPIFTELDNVQTTVQHISSYEFKSAAIWHICVTFKALQNISLGYFGFTQQGVLSGSDVNLYIPKALPIFNGEETLDFRTIAPHNIVPQTMNITTEYWENPELPPDRWIEYSENIGLTSGYLFDYGVGGKSRKDCVSNAFFLYTSRKCYPYGIDNSKVDMLAGTEKSAVVFREYVDRDRINKNGVILMTTFEHANRLYIYADFNAEGEYEMFLPTKYSGLDVTTFEKSDNVTYVKDEITNSLRIKVTASSPMYGYLVAQIKIL